MFTRKKLLGGLIGLFAAGALLAPVAAAPSPALVAVAGVATSDGVGTCTIDINTTWLTTDISGRTITRTLTISDDGGATWTYVGTLVRTENDGSQATRRYDMAAGSYLVHAELTKGPKHLVGSGTSDSIVCTP